VERARIIGGMSDRALVLAHDEVPGRGSAMVGSVRPALAELGYRVAVSTFLPGGPPIPDPEAVDLLVVLGSAAAADDDTLPWLAPERAYLARAIARRTPVLGICFGAQLLARELGGTVGRAVGPERGFVPLRSADPDLLPDGEWLQFHDDTATLPPGAELVAANDSGVQAFRHHRQFGVQFHPEVTPAAFAAWVDAWRVRGQLAAVAVANDLPALAAEIEARADTAAAACRDLVRRLCGRAARADGCSEGEIWPLCR
jgi:GMP synthase (glutamine-hydrolysing)